MRFASLALLSSLSLCLPVSAQMRLAPEAPAAPSPAPATLDRGLETLGADLARSDFSPEPLNGEFDVSRGLSAAEDKPSVEGSDRGLERPLAPSRPGAEAARVRLARLEKRGALLKTAVDVSLLPVAVAPWSLLWFAVHHNDAALAITFAVGLAGAIATYRFRLAEMANDAALTAERSAAKQSQ